MSVPPSLAAVPPPPAVRGDPPIDARGGRFTAAVAAAVLTLALLSESSLLLVAQAAVFGVGAVAGLRFTPYSVAFHRLVAPRLRPATELEDAAPVRYAKAAGAAFALLGATGYLTGLTALGHAATAIALAAIFLNAAFEFCLGCEIHALISQGRRPHQPTIHNQQGVTT